MTTNKSSHAECTHPNTKSARAKCRKERKTLAAADVEWQAEMDELRKDREVEELWNKTYPIFCGAHQASAHQNADDTASEEGFEVYSRRWYEVALSTIHSARDNSPAADLNDPEPGSHIYRERNYYWVDHVIYPASGAEITLVDGRGNRTTHKLADLIVEAKNEENE